MSIFRLTVVLLIQCLMCCALQKKDEIEMFKAQGVQLEEQRQEILKRLESKQERASRDADEFNEKHTAVMKILDQLRAGIESLFDKINCDKNSIDDMLGTNTGVTDSNMLQYLGVIEERTNELLLMQAYVNFHKVGARSVMFLTSTVSVEVLT